MALRAMGGCISKRGREETTPLLPTYSFIANSVYSGGSKVGGTPNGRPAPLHSKVDAFITPRYCDLAIADNTRRVATLEAKVESLTKELAIVDGRIDIEVVTLAEHVDSALTHIAAAAAAVAPNPVRAKALGVTKSKRSLTPAGRQLVKRIKAHLRSIEDGVPRAKAALEIYTVLLEDEPTTTDLLKKSPTFHRSTVDKAHEIYCDIERNDVSPRSAAWVSQLKPLLLTFMELYDSFPREDA